MTTDIIVTAAAALAGCGQAADSPGGEPAVIIEETGSIAGGDTSDSDHAGLLYDAYTFGAERLDVVVIEVRAEGFVPLLKLVESATGAYALTVRVNP